MLVLTRKEGQWVQLVHRSGDVIRIRLYDIRADEGGRARLAFDDGPRNFEVARPEMVNFRSAPSPGEAPR